MKTKKQSLQISLRVSDWVNADEQEDALDYLDYARIAVSRTADNRIVVDIGKWSHLKSHEAIFAIVAGDLYYACTCKPLQSPTAMPCAHILVAVTAAEELGLVDRRGYMVAAKLESAPISTPRHSHSRYWKIGSRNGPYLMGDDETIKALGEMPKPKPAWRPLFAAMRESTVDSSFSDENRWPATKEMLYVVDAQATLDGKGLVIETMARERKKDGGWKRPSAMGTSVELALRLPEPADREIVALLTGAKAATLYSYREDLAARRTLSDAHSRALLPRMCRTGRCFMRRANSSELDLEPLRFDDQGPWKFGINIARDEAEKNYTIEGHIERGGQRVPLSAPVLLTANGHVFFADDTVAELDDSGGFGWIIALRKQPLVRVPFEEAEDLLGELYSVRHLPTISTPESLAVKEESRPMRPRLHIKPSPKGSYGGYYGSDTDDRLIGELSFDYGGEIVDSTTESAAIFNKKTHTLIRRDIVAENAARDRMLTAGFRQQQNYRIGKVVAQLPSKSMPNVIRALSTEGWHVEADGKLYRQAGAIAIDVTSGIDWFDLNVKADFGGVSASLPQLLSAMRKGDHIVQLDDGTFGMLPEEWLKKYGSLAGSGKATDDKVRFSRAQVGFLDALLMSQPQATCDETFRRTRDELRHFDGITPGDPPATFTGELRPYQRDALGWFDFLRRFGFGGCLADDMGLGKTVQVLAMLEDRRLQGETKPAERKPSLVVVPRSLVFNWKQEAARFAPQLKVLDHTNSGRLKTNEHFKDHDLVVTTYGTLRNDVAFMKDQSFDYVVLDEAQTVKNSSSEGAKAVRLLTGNHRLCLSGTPVQNNLGDLWSLFDFLNPGLLGEANVFSSAYARNPDGETRQILSRALRPFILRRTKEQVAKDLPEKLEQTLFCELEPAQRKLYDELREYYRLNLLGQIAEKGMAKSRFMILEALLRLRQAACHPGLIDKKRASEPSAKLDALLPRLNEVVAEGHKALVFSQFTSFLSLVRKQLDKDGIVYEYLDGKTRDRQERVDHFQSDPNCKLFLISLKAGGVGLNLTAADYVFLLDPWWNPAVEAQAIDRTHRIGQTRKVFASRLIAKNTVEEKVLALQQTKRDLADAIINADNSLIRSLGKEDLELLLS